VNAEESKNADASGFTMIEGISINQIPTISAINESLIAPDPDDLYTMRQTNKSSTYQPFEPAGKRSTYASQVTFADADIAAKSAKYGMKDLYAAEATPMTREPMQQNQTVFIRDDKNAKSRMKAIKQH
jgi:hypothetical protein